MSDQRSNNFRQGNWRDSDGNRSRYSRNDNNSYQRSQYNNRGGNLSLTDDEYRLVNQGRDELFNKKKNFPLVTSLKDKSLLLSENLFTTDRWKIDQLMQLKEKLNNTRNRLNEKDIKVWKQLTRKTNMTERVVWSLRNQNDIEMCTNAWIKMAEIFSKYKSLIPDKETAIPIFHFQKIAIIVFADLPENQPFRTVHVCEAPGAFICATNFYYNHRYERQDPRSFQRQWDWTGLSLNPYYEGNDQEAMVDDDRLIIETLEKWYFGRDNSGNILDTNNIQGLWERVRMDPKSLGVHLVTGDGSVDTSGDPNEQESIVSELHYAEAICALGALAKNGSLVLKMFNLFECETICLLYILALHFKELSIFKPASSRAPNGETYVVALGFRGIDQDILNSLFSFVSPTFPCGKALLSLSSIPQTFLDELIKIAAYFTIKQIQALERNLDLEKIWNGNIQQAIFKLNQGIANEFREKCSIVWNYKQSVRIVRSVALDGSAKSLGNSAAVVKGGLRQRSGGTLEDRQNKKRNREEFLSKPNDDSNENDNNDEVEDDGRSVKKMSLSQGKPVVFGRTTPRISTTTDIVTEMDVDSSNNQQQGSTGESKAMKMMKKTGYVEGQGLGVHGQGRATPIEAVMHDTRLGLGHHNQPSITLSSTSSLPIVFDEPLFTSYDQPVSAGLLPSPKELQTKTIGSNLRQVLSSLFVKFDDLELLYKKREEYFKDHNGKKTKIFISDQFEIFNRDEQYRNMHGIYLDYRSAFQLASLDKLFQLTSMKLDDSSPLSFIIDNKLLTGFAEYLVWQQQDQIKGLLIADLSSSLTISKNVIIKQEIDSNHPKVHLFFSDMSILPMNVKIDRRYIEQYNKRQLILSCRYALTKLNQGGHFVCKLQDTLTRFTAGLIYLLYRSFTSICILRPFILDPASPERFLVCRELKYPVDISMIQYLNSLLKYDKIEDILEVVPLKCLIESQFQQYMADTSQRLIQREIQALNKRLWYMSQKNDQTIDSITEEDWNEARECITIPRRPKPSPVEPDSSTILPPGWIKQWSKREGQDYYFNTHTGQSIWEPPN